MGKVHPAAAQPGLCEHAVQLYQEEADLVGAVADFIATGLREQEAVVVVGTTPRWQALMQKLHDVSIDAHAAVLRGQLRFLGAKTVINSCLSHGVPDERRFDAAIGGLLALARARYAAVRVFAEVSDMLWRDGERSNALQIERFWNSLAADEPLLLLCCCPLDSLDGRAYDGSLQALCGAHTHLIPARDAAAFDESVICAVNEVLEPQLARMLHSLVAARRPAVHMPAGQAVLFWLKEHMPRTAEKVLARARARGPEPLK